jgi:hypothetical protein
LRWRRWSEGSEQNAKTTFDDVAQLSDGLRTASPLGTGATKNRARRSLCPSGKLIAQTGRSMTQIENRA